MWIIKGTNESGYVYVSFDESRHSGTGSRSQRDATRFATREDAERRTFGEGWRVVRLVTREEAKTRREIRGLRARVSGLSQQLSELLFSITGGEGLP